MEGPQGLVLIVEPGDPVIVPFVTVTEGEGIALGIEFFRGNNHFVAGNGPCLVTLLQFDGHIVKMLGKGSSILTVKGDQYLALLEHWIIYGDRAKHSRIVPITAVQGTDIFRHGKCLVLGPIMIHVVGQLAAALDVLHLVRSHQRETGLVVGSTLGSTAG